MTRDELLKKIEDARKAIQDYKREGLERTIDQTELRKVRLIETASVQLITEAKTLGAAGNACPRCGGSGRA